jgi:hypothetical protein
MKATKRILTAPFHAVAWTLTLTFDVLSHVNPLLVLVCLLSDE